MDQGESMNSRILGFGSGVAAVAMVALGPSIARAELTSCTTQTAFLEPADCVDRDTGERIGQSVGVAVNGDQSLSFAAGPNGGAFANFQIIQSQIEVRDAEGTLLTDCRFVNNDPRGVLIFGFGAGPACDTAVSRTTIIFYDNEVRL